MRSSAETPPKEHRMDGVSLVPLLTAKETSLPRDLFWHFPCYIGGGGPCSAIRSGDWKLIEFFETKTTELYDLTEDPGEQRNLTATQPQRAAELLATLHARQKSTGAPCPSEPNPACDPNASPKRGREERGKGSNRGKKQP